LNTNSPLGKTTQYISQYNKSLLFPMPRKIKRDEIGISGNTLPFYGKDIWNAYEISWLNKNNRPCVAIGVFTFDCTSNNIIESKSLKLYLNSFNNTQFDSLAEVEKLIKDDLSEATNSKIEVELQELSDINSHIIQKMPGLNIDHLDVACDEFAPNKNLLLTNSDSIHETLNSNLLKSNCLVTSQPDWGSIVIEYKGKKINNESLLKYIISYRNHNEFHEQCVERIFIDIMEACKPNELTIYARYTRRGGIDINPFRTNVKDKKVINLRLVRQ